jgi:NAD(P)-dependent dehydrogenase (short-subunit alcohol dehydrogenase family)
MADRLDGKTAVITGAGSGIGRETASLCAQRGAALALCDVNDAGLAETAELARARGSDVFAQHVDVADAESMDAFAGAVHDHFRGGVDLLVNNAGIGVVATFLETELSDWQRLIDINVMGVVHGCHCFIPAMVERGRGGHVVNVASQAGFQANLALSAYSATKFAVFGFSEALRGELRPYGIGVTAVCPGVVNTAITRTSTVRGQRSGERQAKLQKLYERRGYGPEKVAVSILRAVERDRAVAPVTPEAHVAYVLSRLAPPVSRWTSAKLAGVAR